MLSHRLPVPGDAMLAAAIEMLAGGVVLLAVAAASGQFAAVAWSSVPVTSWLALAYLIGPGSILAFTAYGYALSHLPLTTVSTYAYVNPVVAILAGALILGEQLTWREGAGAALIVGSVIIILHRSRSAAAPDSDRDYPVRAARSVGSRAGSGGQAIVTGQWRQTCASRDSAGTTTLPTASSRTHRQMAPGAPGQARTASGS